MIRTTVAAAAAIAGLVPCVPAMASGGAHVVDDAAVETPGTCHLESWISRTGSEAGLVNSAPACTFRTLPVVEWGGALQHDRADGARSTTLAGPSVKWLIHAPERGPSVALLATAAVDLRRGNVRAASLVVPVTFTLDDRTRVNINGGWTRLARRDSAFYGAQVEHSIDPAVTAMGEVYRLSGATGVQAGLRWTPHAGRVDFDFLAARDSGSDVRLTFGLTIRS